MTNILYILIAGIGFVLFIIPGLQIAGIAVIIVAFAAYLPGRHFEKTANETRAHQQEAGLETIDEKVQHVGAKGCIFFLFIALAILILASLAGVQPIDPLY